MTAAARSRASSAGSSPTSSPQTWSLCSPSSGPAVRTAPGVPTAAARRSASRSRRSRVRHPDDRFAPGRAGPPAGRGPGRCAPRAPRPPPSASEPVVDVHRLRPVRDEFVSSPMAAPRAECVANRDRRRARAAPSPRPAGGTPRPGSRRSASTRRASDRRSRARCSAGSRRCVRAGRPRCVFGDQPFHHRQHCLVDCAVDDLAGRSVAGVKRHQRAERWRRSPPGLSPIEMPIRLGGRPAEEMTKQNPPIASPIEPKPARLA